MKKRDSGSLRTDDLPVVRPTALPSLLALRAFEAAGRHSSFSRAGAELAVTQAAVSHQVRGLEEELGYKLFIRGTRQVSLTDEGRILLGAVGRGLAEIREGLESIRERQPEGWITISVSPSFAIKWLVPRLQDFHRAYPEIEVRLSATAQIVIPGRDGVDCCIRYGEGDYHGLSVELLMEEEVFPVCSPALAKDPRRPLRTLADLRAHQLLHDSMFLGHPKRVGWPHWALHFGLDLDTRAGLHFSHASHAIDAAVAGHGIVLTRGCLADDDLAAGRLVRPFRESHPSPFSYWLVRPRRAGRRAPVDAFVSWLRDAITSSQRNLVQPSTTG